MNCPKCNSPVVFGGYVGTAWREATVYASTEFYKTKIDGYVTILQGKN